MIVAGFGCRAGVSAASVLAVLRLIETASGQAAETLAIPVFRQSEPGLRQAAAALGLPLRVVQQDALEAAQDRCVTRSERARAATGIASVAEGCAVAEAGALLWPRIAGEDVTCALGGPRGTGTVHFIGAGPGAPDLLTLRGRTLLARCPVCLYAGSIVPREMLAHCAPHAQRIDTAPLDLDAIEAACVAAHAAGLDVARLHSGDLSVYSAVAEQLRRLDARRIPYTLTPGVPAFAAAAASLKRELTVPGVAQSLVLTRVSGRASAMPERETLEAFGKTGATLAIHLGIHAIARIAEVLTPLYGADCPVAVVVRASWPDERVLEGTLATIVTRLKANPAERTALVLVGPALEASGFRDSALYSADYRRRFRSGGAT